MARYSFYTTDGPDKGRTFELEPGITLIGRRDTAAGDDPEGSKRWVLTDPAVSRTHARIDWDGAGAPLLIHLSSTNATLLNGKIVTGLTLEDGSRLTNENVIRMGQTGFEVREEAGEPVSPPRTLTLGGQEQSVELSPPGAEVHEDNQKRIQISIGGDTEVSRWCLVERSDEGNEYPLEEHKTVELDGLTFEFDGSRVQVSLVQSDAEAYLLRQIDDQYWTTVVKDTRPLVLRKNDVVQTEHRKMVLTGQQ